jgi:dihydrolipoamide dehydrogenase
MADREIYDLCVIGAGPGGYVACVRAAQLGFKVVCIEKEPRLGGVCLNTGCIPSKALLDSSEYYRMTAGRLGEHGILVDKVELDLRAMMARKDQVVSDLCDNVRKLLEGNKIKVVQGHARILNRNSVEVSPGGDGKSGTAPSLIEAKSILLATGSEPVSLPGIPFDGSAIVSSTEALGFASVPEHLAIVGGGYIGLELGSVWNRLGSKVTVIEMLPTIASNLDGQIRRAFERSLARQGFTFRLQTRVLKARAEADEIQLVVEADGREEVIACDRLLVAVGRRPLTRGLGLEEAGVRMDPENGRVWVDEDYRTSVPSIYAIGDLIAGPMLAHKASAEGVAAVECMAGLSGEVNYDAIPAVVYTFPEVASVGLTEEEVHARGIEHNVGTYPFAGAGRARCMGETEGLVKIITHARTDRILGVHILGPRASDLIGEGVLAIECNMTSSAFARAVHGHPTLSEALHEAALAVKKCSIYAS